MKFSGQRGKSIGGNKWYTTAEDQTKKSEIEVVWPYSEKAKGQFDTEGVQ